MAVDWIKIRTDLDRSVNTFRISRLTGLPVDGVVVRLYRLASWFAVHGKYGKSKESDDVVDSVVEFDGFARAMKSVGWLRSSGGVMVLHGFTSVSATRKSLGRKVRRSILENASCAACGSSSGDLVVDHIIPIVRGGSCDISNLQALCGTCNSRKGKKTMKEFMNNGR